MNLILIKPDDSGFLFILSAFEIGMKEPRLFCGFLKTCKKAQPDVKFL